MRRLTWSFFPCTLRVRFFALKSPRLLAKASLVLLCAKGFGEIDERSRRPRGRRRSLFVSALNRVSTRSVLVALVVARARGPFRQPRPLGRRLLSGCKGMIYGSAVHPPQPSCAFSHGQTGPYQYHVRRDMGKRSRQWIESTARAARPFMIRRAGQRSSPHLTYEGMVGSVHAMLSCICVPSKLPPDHQSTAIFSRGPNAKRSELAGRESRY